MFLQREREVRVDMQLDIDITYRDIFIAEEGDSLGPNVIVRGCGLLHELHKHPGAAWRQGCFKMPDAPVVCPRPMVVPPVENHHALLGVQNLQHPKSQNIDCSHSATVALVATVSLFKLRITWEQHLVHRFDRLKRPLPACPAEQWLKLVRINC